jgi:hypothetical protein
VKEHVGAGDRNMVAISICNGLQGFIHGHGEFFHIQPALPHQKHQEDFHKHQEMPAHSEAAPPPHGRRSLAETFESDHIVFRTSDMQEEVSCGVQHDDHDHHGEQHLDIPSLLASHLAASATSNESHDHAQTYRQRRSLQQLDVMKEIVADTIKGEKSASQKPLWVELFVVNDHARYETRNLPGYAGTEDIVNQMDALFRIGNFLPALRIRLVAQETWAAGDLIPYEPNPADRREVYSSQLLKAFSNYRVEQKSSLPKHDNAQLFSGVDFDGDASGLATVGTMCRHSRSCSVNQMTHSLALNAAVAAHEMGHNFGMRHDSDLNTCPQSGYIMNAVMTFSKTPETWSTCSRNYLDAFFAHAANYNCLDSDTPTRGRSEPDVCGDVFLAPTNNATADGSSTHHCSRRLLQWKMPWRRVSIRMRSRLQCAEREYQGAVFWLRVGRCATCVHNVILP